MALLSKTGKLFKMPNWQSPTELQAESDVFVKFMHTLLGLYM